MSDQYSYHQDAEVAVSHQHENVLPRGANSSFVAESLNYSADLTAKPIGVLQT